MCQLKHSFEDMKVAGLQSQIKWRAHGAKKVAVVTRMRSLGPILFLMSCGT